MGRKAYSLKELAGKKGAKAAERAMNWCRELYEDDNWWDAEYRFWQDALAKIGFTNVEISFSGFWNQGDGASFTADVNHSMLIRFMATVGCNPADHIDAESRECDYISWLLYHTQYKSNKNFGSLLGYVGQMDCFVRRTTGSYAHEMTCMFVVETVDGIGEEVGKLVDELERGGELLRRAICREIYAGLEKEWDYLNSDEGILSLAEANGWTFDRDGERYG